MPYTFRHPRVIFPGLTNHPLYSTFRNLDKSFILPEGKPVFVPFNASNICLNDYNQQSVDMLVAVPANSYVRLRRIHLWIEPDIEYPRGTQLKLRMGNPRNILGSVITVYSGMYYIFPVDIEMEYHQASTLHEVINFDQQVCDSNTFRLYVTWYDKALTEITTNFPIFTMLAELR